MFYNFKYEFVFLSSSSIRGDGIISVKDIKLVFCFHFIRERERERERVRV